VLRREQEPGGNPGHPPAVGLPALPQQQLRHLVIVQEGECGIGIEPRPGGQVREHGRVLQVATLGPVRIHRRLPPRVEASVAARVFGERQGLAGARRVLAGGEGHPEALPHLLQAGVHGLDPVPAEHPGEIDAPLGDLRVQLEAAPLEVEGVPRAQGLEGTSLREVAPRSYEVGEEDEARHGGISAWGHWSYLSPGGPVATSLSTS